MGPAYILDIYLFYQVNLHLSILNSTFISISIQFSSSCVEIYEGSLRVSWEIHIMKALRGFQDFLSVVVVQRVNLLPAVPEFHIDSSTSDPAP